MVFFIVKGEKGEEKKKKHIDRKRGREIEILVRFKFAWGVCLCTSLNRLLIGYSLYTIIK